MATVTNDPAHPVALEGARKAAILMVLLGEEASSLILQHFDEHEILAIGREVAGLGEIEQELAGKVLHEYRERIMTSRETHGGGHEAARRILARTLSPERAAALDALLGDAARAALGGSERGAEGAAGSNAGAGADAAFRALGEVDERALAGMLEIEHPQTAALVLLNLAPPRAAAVLSTMNEETQTGVTARLARLSAISPEVTREVAEALSVRFESTREEGVEERDGLGAAAEILKAMDRGRSRAILARLDSADPESAEKLRSKVYTFEMLLMLPDRGIQEILKGVDSKQLGLALKGTVPEVSEKFFKNMSTRAAEMVKDEMEFLGAAKVKDVEAAQKEILDKALRLEEEGVLQFETPEAAQ